MQAKSKKMKNCKQISAILPLYEQVLVLADANIASRIEERLGQYGIHRFPTLILEATESDKSLATVERIWSFLFDHHATRKALLIHIGGGLICDLGGFAAATYKRGIDFLNIPTTLLAMADAAHGGKTGFNYRGLKNAIGLIRQPLATLIDTAWLTTLDNRQILSGYAEILKCGLLDSTEAWQQAVRNLESGDFTSSLSMAIALKERIVAADEQEQGLRKTLNLGHTVGHALEELFAEQHNPLPHGFCVLYGLVAALYLSVTKLGLAPALLTQTTHLMVDYYSRPSCNCKDFERLIDLTREDKKNTRAGVRAFTLLSAPGQAQINCPVSDAELREALDYLFSA